MLSILGEIGGVEKAGAEVVPMDYPSLFCKDGKNFFHLEFGLAERSHTAQQLVHQIKPLLQDHAQIAKVEYANVRKYHTYTVATAKLRRYTSSKKTAQFGVTAQFGCGPAQFEIVLEIVALL